MTREQILENKYFCKVEEQVEERDEMITDFGTRDLLPSILLKYFDSELLMSSLGGLIFYLKSVNYTFRSLLNYFVLVIAGETAFIIQK